MPKSKVIGDKEDLLKFAYQVAETLAAKGHDSGVLISTKAVWVSVAIGSRYYQIPVTKKMLESDFVFVIDSIEKQIIRYN